MTLEQRIARHHMRISIVRPGLMSEAMVAVANELDQARAKHPEPLRSTHEAIAVIREEYLEAEREVFHQHCDRGMLAKELVQIAAMCVRTLEDLGL